MAFTAVVDWDARRHLKMADVIGLATAQGHADSQECGERAACA